jgi:lysophospholipase L1-like esterase
MVDSIQAAGAACALVEVRMAVVSPYLPDLKRISREKKTLLIPNILQGILSDPGLKSDQMHPNSRGYELMARRIYRQIKPYL